ncbi:MAG: terminase small subunit [Pseudomonadota bacterium]|nr:terminase small subunit [Pseudomonadota bacterium]MED5380764.1 terminase small subunit [Pseudomonadota bacterium]MEE3129549.1 terminase small subunit [Pseudomonadota bacterium]MEE3273132.1 terminase small subunit [Pseudomonadota bacterium]
MAQVNRAELAEILGVSLPTITSKVSKGMPFEQRGGRGREWSFDTAAVFEWEKEQAIINATGDLSSVTDDELKRRKLAAETMLVELEAGKKRGDLIPREEIEKMLVNLVLDTKARLLLVPRRCAPLLTQLTSEQEIRDIIEEEQREALTDLSNMEIDPAD